MASWDSAPENCRFRPRMMPLAPPRSGPFTGTARLPVRLLLLPAELGAGEDSGEDAPPKELTLRTLSNGEEPPATPSPAGWQAGRISSAQIELHFFAINVYCSCGLICIRSATSSTARCRDIEKSLNHYFHGHRCFSDSSGSRGAPQGRLDEVLSLQPGDRLVALRLHDLRILSFPAVLGDRRGEAKDEAAPGLLVNTGLASIAAPLPLLFGASSAGQCACADGQSPLLVCCVFGVRTISMLCLGEGKEERERAAQSRIKQYSRPYLQER